MYTYDTDTIEGFEITYVFDEDSNAPWENSDCHGPVRKSGTRHSQYQSSDKKPGERPLNNPDRNEYQFYYDWQSATQSARADGWNAEPYDAPNRVQRAVQADFEYLRAWVQNEWLYVGIVITDPEGKEVDSLWGVEIWKDYHKTQASEMVQSAIAAREREALERQHWAERDVCTV